MRDHPRHLRTHLYMGMDLCFELVRMLSSSRGRRRLHHGRRSKGANDVLSSFRTLTAFRRLCKMGRTDSIFIGLRRAIPCWNEDEEIYNFAVEGFSRFNLELGRKSTSCSCHMFRRIFASVGTTLLFLVIFFT